VNVSAAGPGSPPILDSPVRLSAPAIDATPGKSDDSVGSLLQLLSTPQIHDLLHTIDAHRLAQDPATLESLLQTAGDAVAHHDVPRALAALTEYINRNPAHAAVLPMSPALLPIQGDVKELLRNITEGARTEAVRSIAAAGLVVDGAARHPEGLNGADVVAAAERFAESGQLVNYFRAAELSQTVITFYGGSAAAPVRGKAVWSAARLWRRVPMLVLLVGWLGAGVIMLLLRVNAAAIEVWGVGFLVLVVLQFRISVRGIRS
jgi:hypothetical protein